MAPNLADHAVQDPNQVGDFEADPDEIKDRQAVASLAKKPRKLIHVKTFSMDATLPEQGAWHYDRKKQILAKYPKIKELYGQNPWSFVIMLVGVITQTFIGISLAQAPWWVLLLVSYTLGAYVSWVCIVMGHEGSHGLVFANKHLNKLHTIIAFLPVFLGPFGTFWSIEHMYHHQVVVDKMNRYGPQQAPIFRKILSTLLFINALGVLFFLSSIIALVRSGLHHVQYLLGQKSTPFPEAYKLRPYRNFPQVANSTWFFINMIMIAVFNSVVAYNYGLRPIVYFFLANGFCNGLHPLGMRQVQEHYMQRKGQPTNSVYSSLSFFLLNIGYHNEHHDFPTIPWNRLPLVRKMAPEFYNNLFFFNSYTQVFWDFFMNPGIPYTSLLEDSMDTNPAKSKKTE